LDKVFSAGLEQSGTKHTETYLHTVLPAGPSVLWPHRAWEELNLKYQFMDLALMGLMPSMPDQFTKNDWEFKKLELKSSSSKILQS